MIIMYNSFLWEVSKELDSDTLIPLSGDDASLLSDNTGPAFKGGFDSGRKIHSIFVR